MIRQRYPHSSTANSNNNNSHPSTTSGGSTSSNINSSSMPPALRFYNADDADVAAGAQERAAALLLSASSSFGGDETPQQHQSSSNSNQQEPQQQHALRVSTGIGMGGHYFRPKTIPAPMSSNSIETRMSSDIEFFEDLVSEPVLVLGVDISHLSRQWQFVVCASGVFVFSLFYGYLQELISVTLCSRKLGLFLAMVQFAGYTILAYVMRSYVYEQERKNKLQRSKQLEIMSGNGIDISSSASSTVLNVPLKLYLGLSLLRAIDLGMTNLAMQYINYPAKTLMKSSRIVFTMLFGVVIARKKYTYQDYLIVVAMVAGLALFLHADANSAAVFHHMGVSMLTVSLLCDGAITNMSESIMSKFGVGQDEFIFRMYSISLVAITAAASFKGDLREGFYWLSQPGTYDELALPISERTWSVPGKIACLTLFSTMGFFGSSCSAAITKNFGALSMSITSTARKATTLFLSFFLFNNVCTMEHLTGIIVFITALTAKSLRRRGKSKSNKAKQHQLERDQRKQREIVLQHYRNNAMNNTPPVVEIPTAVDKVIVDQHFPNGGSSTNSLESISSEEELPELAALLPSTPSAAVRQRTKLPVDGPQHQQQVESSATSTNLVHVV